MKAILTLVFAAWAGMAGAQFSVNNDTLVIQFDRNTISPYQKPQHSFKGDATVVITLAVNEKGNVVARNADPSRSLGATPELIDYCLRAAATIRFEPCTGCQEPVAHAYYFFVP